MLFNKRDVMLQLLKAVLERDVKASFTPELLESAVVKVIENIDSEVELKLSSDFEASLADNIQQRLQKADSLIGITKDSSLSKSLIITKKDQGWNYQISPEAVTELLAMHLSNKWLEILNGKTEK